MQNIADSSEPGSRPDPVDGPAGPLYLMLAVIGSLAVPIYLGVTYLQGLWSWNVLFAQLFANPISIALLLDISLSALIFWIFAARELRRFPQRGGLAPYVLLVGIIGLCCALPIFLYRRFRHDPQA